LDGFALQTGGHPEEGLYTVLVQHGVDARLADHLEHLQLCHPLVIFFVFIFVFVFVFVAFLRLQLQQLDDPLDSANCQSGVVCGVKRDH